MLFLSHLLVQFYQGAVCKRTLVLFICVCMFISVPTFVDSNLAAQVQVISLYEWMKVVSLATKALSNPLEHLFFPLFVPRAKMDALENCFSCFDFFAHVCSGSF